MENIKITMPEIPKLKITMPGYGSGGTTNHAKLSNLDFNNSGHTGFQKELSKEQMEKINNAITVVDSEMSDTSENPVQNKIIKKYIDNNISGGEISGEYYAKVDGVEITPDGDITIDCDYEEPVSLRDNVWNISPRYFLNESEAPNEIWMEAPNDTRYVKNPLTANPYSNTIRFYAHGKILGSVSSIIFSTGEVVPPISYEALAWESGVTFAGDDCDKDGDFIPQPNKTYELVGKWITDKLYSVRVGTIITTPAHTNPEEE